VPPRPILTAELLSIGTELTVGETRDTNAGDIARSLTGIGVVVRRIQALPDDLAAVEAAFRAAIATSDLVVSTGGLGPTPDDLTREAIAAAVGETPAVNAALERWLRELWARRGMPFPELNLKQAWLIPSATALANPNGTAPGWWVDRADGGVLVALPGPPREMRPMWSDDVLSRLRSLGAGTDIASRTLRLRRIGESQVAELIGEPILRAADPQVATYARADAVDLRISARGRAADGSSAETRVAAMTDQLVQLLGDHVWAESETSWPDAIGDALAPSGRLAIVEVGTGGSLTALLGDRDWLAFAESLAIDAAATREHAGRRGLEELARHGLQLGAASHAVGVRARGRGRDTSVSVVVLTPTRVHRERHAVFLGGRNGRIRAALTAADVLVAALRREAASGVSGGRRAAGPRGRG
jgi:nicotinamide-nucleotide amidase